MAITEDELNAVAARMLADYDAVNPGSIYDEGFRLELPDAWRLQTAVTKLREARGEKVIGYKVGCVDPGNQNAMDLPHPVWGRLWQSEIYDGGVTLKKSDYMNIAIEAEFGITLSQDLRVGMSIDEIAASVSAVQPVLELHNLVMYGDRPHGHQLVANNCINCGVVRGAPITDLSVPRQTDLKLVYDSRVVGEWGKLRWPEDILGAVEWLVGSLAAHEIQLKAGDLVLTSAWGPPVPVKDCERVDVMSSGFGEVFARFS